LYYSQSNYSDLPKSTPTGQTIRPSEAKQQRCLEIISDAYAIYESDLESDAQIRLQDFQKKWSLLELDAVRTFMNDVQWLFFNSGLIAALYGHWLKKAVVLRYEDFECCS